MATWGRQAVRLPYNRPDRVQFPASPSAFVRRLAARIKALRTKSEIVSSFAAAACSINRQSSSLMRKYRLSHEGRNHWTILVV